MRNSFLPYIGNIQGLLDFIFVEVLAAFDLMTQSFEV